MKTLALILAFIPREKYYMQYVDVRLHIEHSADFTKGRCYMYSQLTFRHTVTVFLKQYCCFEFIRRFAVANTL